MKKVLYLFCLVAILATGCKESRYEKDAEAYAGKYSGEFSTTRNEENVKLDTITIFEIRQCVDVPADLILENNIHLARTDDGYVFDEETLTPEQRTTIFNLCGIEDEFYFVGAVDKITVKAQFYSGNLTFYIRYKNGEDFLGTTTFTGTRL